MKELDAQEIDLLKAHCDQCDSYWDLYDPHANERK